MMTFLTHPLHGTHIAYTDQEIALCKKNGWTERDTEPHVARLVAESQAPATSEPGNRGVAPAPINGVPCSKCGKVFIRGRVMHERFCKASANG